MKRICVNLTNEQAALLKVRADETGVLQSEIIRRAITCFTTESVTVILANNGERAIGVETQYGVSSPIEIPRPAHLCPAAFINQYPAPTSEEWSAAIHKASPLRQKVNVLFTQKAGE